MSRKHRKPKLTLDEMLAKKQLLINNLEMLSKLLDRGVTKAHLVRVVDKNWTPLFDYYTPLTQ